MHRLLDKTYAEFQRHANSENSINPAKNVCPSTLPFGAADGFTVASNSVYSGFPFTFPFTLFSCTFSHSENLLPPRCPTLTNFSSSLTWFIHRLNLVFPQRNSFFDEFHGQRGILRKNSSSITEILFHLQESDSSELDNSCGLFSDYRTYSREDFYDRTPLFWSTKNLTWNYRPTSSFQYFSSFRLSIFNSGGILIHFFISFLCYAK